MTGPMPAKHYTASAIIISSAQPAKVLLVHHAKFDKWTQPGGHQEPHENPLQAVIRETLEETGLDITAYLPAVTALDPHTSVIPVPNYLLEEAIPAHKNEPAHYHLDMTYVVRLPEQAVQHDRRESKAIGWFTMEEIQTLHTFDDLRVLLKQELSK